MFEMFKIISWDKTKKTAAILLLSMTLFLGVSPVAQAASIAEILLGGVAEYYYLQNTLNKMHYNGNKDLLSNYKKEYGVNETERANKQLDSVMTRLLAVIGEKEEIKPEYSWFVNNQESFNAFCGLGHNVSVNIGLFKYINYNEDQLAFVLAHELVHGQENHSLKSIKKTVPMSVAQSLYMASNPNMASNILSTITTNMMVANYATLPMEKEADRLSFENAVNAGYNPGAAAAIWARVRAKNGDGGTSVFENIVNPNDHPTNGQRITYFADRLTEYSNKKVKVQGNSIYVNDKLWTSSVAAGGLLPDERAYFIAGSLATVFHKYPEGKPAYAKDGIVMMDGLDIMTPVEGDSPAGELASSLNRILNL